MLAVSNPSSFWLDSESVSYLSCSVDVDDDALVMRLSSRRRVVATVVRALPPSSPSAQGRRDAGHVRLVSSESVEA